MALTPGTLLGPYEITAQIGVGGMGEVYRATDKNLGRGVAIKVLPEAFAQDAERLARFEREAKTLASLNHPNIAIIHGLEKGDAVRALVMEFVEGPTLAERVATGPIPIDEALTIAKQIAEALEAAHEQSIIHRDLKPANIKVREDGTVKVLDFGLAKIIAGPAEAGHYGDGPAQAGHYITASMSPTITTPAMTQLGVILGTAAYMAPEQARGKPVDKRSDIWAFGCVLFEMLTGKKAFDGEDVTDTIAAVVRAEPQWEALPVDVPASIRLLLRRCLEKDRKKRIGDIAAALFVMREADVVAAPTRAITDTSLRRSPWSRAAAFAATSVVAATVAGTGAWMMMRADAPRVSRLELTTSGASQLARHLATRHVAVTPDGSRVVYVAGAPGEPGAIYERRLDRLAPTLIATNAANAFVKADGQWVGYFAFGQLRKVAITGGPSIDIARIDGGPRGATWGRDDTIIFATAIEATGLLRVPASGGEPVVLTRPDLSKGERDHVNPHFLPDQRAVLFTITSAADDQATSQVAVLDLRTAGAVPKILMRGGSDGRYLASGHLVYLADNALRAVPFDIDRLEVTSDTSIPLAPSINAVASGAGDFDIAENGTLVYAPLGNTVAPQRTLVWVDRQGKEEPLDTPPHTYLYPRVSPDGTRLAIDMREQEDDIWVWDLSRRNLTRVTQGSALDRTPVWAADGQFIIFSSNRDGVAGLYRQRADGTGAAERLTKPTVPQFPLSVSPDGAEVLLHEGAGGPNFGDLMIMRVTAQRSDAAGPSFADTRPLVKTADGELNGTISRDGRWLAYQSNQSGNWDIYVQALNSNGAGSRSTVSTAGGTQPRWAPNGRELYYVSSLNEMMRVVVGGGAAWSAGAPERLFDASAYFIGSTASPFFNYDVAKDGRFLMIKPLPRPTSDADTSFNLIVVQNWFEEFRRLVSGN